MIENICGTCGKRIRSPEEQRGLQMKCPVCADPFVVGVDPEPEEEDAGYGLSGGSPPEPEAPPKKAAKSGKSGKAKPAAPAAPAKPAARADGKVECPTCNEFTPGDREQCAYCGDLLGR